MNVKKALPWIVLSAAVLLFINYTMLPMFNPQVEVVAQGELVDAGRNVDGEGVYFRIKAEVREWSEILKGAGPTILGILALLIGRRRK